MNTGPPAPHEKPAKQRSGCLIAVYVLFGVGLLVVLMTGGFLAWFASTEEGERILTGVRESVAWITEASQAEGTGALREAGCDLGMVTTTGRFAEAVLNFVPEQHLEEARDSMARSEFGDMVVVICMTERFSAAAPPCDELAVTWTRAVLEPPERFLLRTQRQGNNEPICQGLYDGGGVLLRTVADDEFEESFSAPRP